MTTTAPNEAEDLNVHVAVCQQRYNNLSGQQEAMKQDIKELREDLKGVQSGMKAEITATESRINERLGRLEKIMIGTAGTILVAFGGAFFTFLFAAR